MQIRKIQHAKNTNMLNIFVYTTGVCNYSCRYCSFAKYKNNQFLNLNDLKTFIIELYKIKKQNIYIELIGGEPTLDNKLLDFSNNLAYYYPYITIGIYTNFSQNFELYNSLAKNHVNLTLTWHSTKTDKQNNIFIKKLLNFNYKYFKQNVEVHVMYENDNILNSIYAYNKILKINSYSTELCLLDRNFKTNQIYFLNNEFYSNKQLTQYTNIINKQKITNDRKFFKILYDNNHIEYLSLSEIYNKPEFYNFKNWYCEAGKSYLYIDITGNIYPCFQYFNRHTNIIGNIYNINNIKFKSVICPFESCPCVWETYKKQIFKK